MVLGIWRWIREVVRDGAGADEHGALGRGDRVGQPTPEQHLVQSPSRQPPGAPDPLAHSLDPERLQPRGRRAPSIPNASAHPRTKGEDRRATASARGERALLEEVEDEGGAGPVAAGGGAGLGRGSEEGLGLGFGEPPELPERGRPGREMGMVAPRINFQFLLYIIYTWTNTVNGPHQNYCLIRCMHVPLSLSRTTVHMHGSKPTGAVSLLSYTTNPHFFG